MNQNTEHGFTLIELSIVLVVIGLLALPFIQEYRSHIIETTYTETRTKIDSEVAVSVQRYYERYGFYPCPERDITLPVSDNAFGRVNEVTAANQDCPSAGELAANSVLYGHLPIQELDIDSTLAIDSWGNKITYAVTARMVNHPLNGTGDPNWDFIGTTGMDYSAAANDGLPDTNPAKIRGAIREAYVIDSTTTNAPSVAITNTTGATPEAQVDAFGEFALISYGSTGLGAYNTDGALVGACPGAGASHDAENCDNDDLLHSNRSTFERSTTLGANFYDDFVLVSDSSRGGFWSFAQTNNIDTYTDYRIMGINVTDPMSGLIGTSGDKRVGVDVGGTIQLESTADPDERGNVHATEYCDETGTNFASGSNNCFNSEIIAGSGINCGASTVGMRGVANNGPLCLTFVPLSLTECTQGSISAGPGIYVKKIYADGSTCCGAPADDPAVICP